VLDTPVDRKRNAAQTDELAGPQARDWSGFDRGGPSWRGLNAMSVDVEDYFQVQALASAYPRTRWEDQVSRVEANTDRVLALFDRMDVKATFFTLGWVAERHKALIRRIVDAGHELASHGFAHIRADSQDPEQFREDVRRTKAVLEDVGGARVRGYRAATFSIGERNPWAFEILAQEGYRYSSSVYPIRHDYYGMATAPRHPFRPVADDSFLEIPISTVRLMGRNLPCGGGGYFRLFPYPAAKWAVRRRNRREGSASIFYFHPWELDPAQPRPSGLPLKARLRHYTNLARMEDKLERLLRDFDWGRMDDVFDIA